MTAINTAVSHPINGHMVRFTSDRVLSRSEVSALLNWATDLENRLRGESAPAPRRMMAQPVQQQQAQALAPFPVHGDDGPSVPAAPARAKKTAYTCPAVPGSLRTSHRPYTHCIVGRFSHPLAAAMARGVADATRTAERNRLAKDWAYYAADAVRTVGDVRINHNNYPMAVRDYEIEIAQRLVAEHPTAQAYIAAREANIEASIAQHHDGRGIEPLGVLQWSMSEANARRALSTFSGRAYIDLRVVPVLVVTATRMRPETFGAAVAALDL